MYHSPLPAHLHTVTIDGGYWADKPWTDKPWTQQTLDTTNPGHDKLRTGQTLDTIEVRLRARQWILLQNFFPFSRIFSLCCTLIFHLFLQTTGT
jgi:hypothetical protein